MAEITASLVKELREKTGAGMMDCKKALTAVAGDIEKAIDFLREKGLASAAKKSSRTAAEGAVSTIISEDGKTAVITEVNCETDFVAQTDKFKDFAKEIGEFIATAKAAVSLDELKEKATAAIANIGENIVVRRYNKYDLSSNGLFESYIHMQGKIGVLVEMASDDLKDKAAEVKTIARDVAMHIAASDPAYLSDDQIPQDVLDHEKEIFKAQAMEEGKPEAIAEKMVAGRLKKRCAELCLLDQPFVKNPDVTVAQYVADSAKALGINLSVKQFTRFQTGEGIEKKEENFAEEIQKQIDAAN